jgi:hypothetical protein
MGLSDTQKETTPFINITTKAAFPEIELPDDMSDVEKNPVTEKPHPTEKVVLSYCSELSDYTAPVTLFDAKHKLKIFHDSRAQPILFTAGTDEVSLLLSSDISASIGILVNSRTKPIAYKT